MNGLSLPVLTGKQPVRFAGEFPRLYIPSAEDEQPIDTPDRQVAAALFQGENPLELMGFYIGLSLINAGMGSPFDKDVDRSLASVSCGQQLDTGRKASNNAYAFWIRYQIQRNEDNTPLQRVDMGNGEYMDLPLAVASVSNVMAHIEFERAVLAVGLIKQDPDLQRQLLKALFASPKMGRAQPGTLQKAKALATLLNLQLPAKHPRLNALTWGKLGNW